MHLRTWRSRNRDTASRGEAHCQRRRACSNAQQSYPAPQSVGDPTTSQQISHSGKPKGAERGKPPLAYEASQKLLAYEASQKAIAAKQVLFYRKTASGSRFAASR